MNKLIFVCLLSISLCYSLPTETPAADPKAPSPANPEPTPTTAPNATQDKNEPIHAETTIKVPIASSTTVLPKVENASMPANATNKTAPDSKEKNKKDGKPIENKTEGAAKPEGTTTMKPAKPEEKVTAKPNQTTVMPEKTTVMPEKTTPKPELSTSTETTVKPTATPHTEDKQDALVQARGFDGASFIGGMILTVGLLAVGFIGFKYYKNHAERNYHTL